MKYEIFVEKFEDRLFCLQKELSEIIVSDVLFCEKEFVSKFVSGSKFLRSVFLFLLQDFFSLKDEKKVFSIAKTIELVHIATLIHDDIIDKSLQRRNLETFNCRFSNSFAVLLGDWILSLSFDEVLKFDNREMVLLFLKTLKTMCCAEFYQYFQKNRIISLENYVEKCRKKTATLFELGAYFLCESENFGFEINKHVKNFAKYFGVAFQISNDLKNVLQMEEESFENSDFNSGIFTSSVLFAIQKEPNLLNLKTCEILKILKSKENVTKTVNLVEKYVNLAVFELEKINKNVENYDIIKLCRMLKEIKL